LFLGWLHEAEMSYGSKKNDKEGKQTEQPALTDDSATNVCFGNHQETSAYDVQFYSFFFFLSTILLQVCRLEKLRLQQARSRRSLILVATDCQ
jgi:hypothetical protein